MRGRLHESFDLHNAVPAGSERGFALVFTVVFALVAAWPLLHGDSLRGWAAVVAAGFALAGVFAPRSLAPLNRLWFRFGLLLGRIVSPLVMALIFYGTVVPTGLLMRMLGKDILRLRLDPDVASYWIERDPPGPAAGSFERQF
jgi:predicted membrane metal-binding protein